MKTVLIYGGRKYINIKVGYTEENCSFVFKWLSELEGEKKKKQTGKTSIFYSHENRHVQLC